LAEANELPTLEDMEHGRDNKEAYILFCSKFVPGVMGSAAFRLGCCTQKLEEYCSVSDEAMTFLILANNWEPWTVMLEAKKTQGAGASAVKRLDECGVKQKYFKETKGRGHSWSNEGKIYFNNIYDKIEQDRDDNGDKFDEYFLEYMRTESNEGKRLDKLQTKQSKPVIETIVLRNDWDRAQERKKRNRNHELSETKKGSKKYRIDLNEDEIAAEQAQRLGASCVVMM
jgi:hypothetical protein